MTPFLSYIYHNCNTSIQKSSHLFCSQNFNYILKFSIAKNKVLLQLPKFSKSSLPNNSIDFLVECRVVSHEGLIGYQSQTQSTLREGCHAKPCMKSHLWLMCECQIGAMILGLLCQRFIFQFEILVKLLAWYLLIDSSRDIGLEIKVFCYKLQGRNSRIHLLYYNQLMHALHV